LKLLMVSGDRQVAIGERGPFHAMQREFSRWFERIDVLCPRPPGEVRVRTLFERVHFHPATCGRAGMVAYIARRGAELIAAHGHRLIVSHDYGWFYNGLGSARLSRATGVPYVSEIHHVPGYPVAADLRERLDRTAARLYVRWARHRCAAFRVVNHEEIPPLLQRWGVPADKIVVLPSLYIDLETFRPGPERAEPAQDVVFVGRLVNNKGLDRIVDALDALRREWRPVSALFVGKGPLADTLRRRVARRGLQAQVRFLEWVDSPAELAQVYRESRAIVCASTCEGGPRVTVEAMACGTPPVSTPVGMMKELVRSGENGELVGFDVPDLAAGLRRLLEDEPRRRRLGAAAARAARRFEYAATLRGYAEGLHAVAGEPLP
jgi:glycosyltransferase involved in cell wall biosynthesis